MADIRTFLWLKDFVLFELCNAYQGNKYLNLEQYQEHNMKIKLPGTDFDLFVGWNRTDVCPNGLRFIPVTFFKASKAFRGSL